MEIVQSNKCFKMDLPNGKVVDVLNPVLDEIANWIQDQPFKPESGGYLIGYQHSETENISLEAASHPYTFDNRNRVRFSIRDPRHYIFLKKARRRKSYYMGVWHTHPESVPEPSKMDWDDWRQTLKSDRTGCQYVFLIIAGYKAWRMWVGDFTTCEITEIFESKKDFSGLYIKESVKQNENHKSD